jgi:hypothetical protein
MDPGPLTANIAAVVISLLAVAISSFLAMRQAVLARQANQITTFVDLLSEARSAEFRNREYAVWRDLPQHDPKGGFGQLSDEERTNVEVVCSFYSAVAYCIAIGVLDHDLALVPIRYRLLRTWASVLPLLSSEREARGDGDSYFSLLEDMVRQARITDQRRSEQRLSRRAFPTARRPRAPVFSAAAWARFGARGGGRLGVAPAAGEPEGGSGEQMR